MGEVSIFKDVRDVSNPFNRTIQTIYERITTGASRELVEQYRTTGDDKFKRQLPGYCFAGTFQHRSKAGLIAHSGMVVIDLDDVFDAVELRGKLSTLPQVVMCFVSPSGNGVKAVFRIPAEPDNHESYFASIAEQIDEDVDESGKDYSRFCFESYDPDCYFNPDATEWTDKIEPDGVENLGGYAENIPVPLTSENQIIQRLQVWFDKNYSMGKGDRNNNLFKFAASLSDFGVPQQVAQSHLGQYVTSDFTSKEITSTIRSAYKRGAPNFNTKAFEDRAERVRIEKKIRSGKSKKDIERDLKGRNSPLAGRVDEVTESIKSEMEVDEFWYYDHNGKIKLSPHKFKFFLEGANYMKYYPTDTDTFTFIRKEGNLIEETTVERIKDFVMEYLLTKDGIGYTPYDFIANRTATFALSYLSMLKSADIAIQSDTKKDGYLYFQNCAVLVQTDKVEQIDYLNLSGYVWKKQVIQRDYTPTDHHPSEFRTFIWKIAGEDEDKYNSFKSIIGYFLHSHKTASGNRAVILNDETISDNPNGGSGKGLFWNALAKMKKVSMIDGKTFDFNKSFPYQTVSTDCQVLVFDDVKKNFAFESLFSVITEGITIEYKGQDAVKLPVEDSPKILITTNYTVGGSGGSFERRKFEAEFSAYFNVDYTPEDEFGHMLFDDWDDNEWARFDAYMINCLQYYLEHGLVGHDFKNLRTRKFIKDTSSEWYEYTSEHDWCKRNARNSKGDAFDAFLNEFPDQKKYSSQRRFKSWLKHYCKFYGFTYSEGNTNGTRWFMIGDGGEEVDGDVTPF